MYTSMKTQYVSDKLHIKQITIINGSIIIERGINTEDIYDKLHI